MARTARRNDGGDALTELMRDAGAAPRRTGAPGEARHRSEPPVAVTKANPPSSGKLRRISALSAGGVAAVGLVALFVAPSDDPDIITGIPPSPPTLSIEPQAHTPEPPMPSPSLPPGGTVAAPPPAEGSMSGGTQPESETTTEAPPPPAPPSSTVPSETSDPRADYYDYYYWYYSQQNSGQQYNDRHHGGRGGHHHHRGHRGGHR